MPKYRFVTDDGKKVDRGEDTLEFPNDGAAADAAQQALADMVQDALPNGQSLNLSAAVQNTEGDKVYHASLKFHGETAEQARFKAAEIHAGADDAADAVARAVSANLKKTPT